jgi:hypothetical protein
VNPEKPTKSRGGIPYGNTPEQAKAVALIREMWKAGARPAAIAVRLNESGFRTMKGLEWTGYLVGVVLRCDAASRRATMAPATPAPGPVPRSSKRK